MGERVRKACPCLETLWQRIYGNKKDSKTTKEEEEEEEVVSGRANEEIVQHGDSHIKEEEEEEDYDNRAQPQSPSEGACMYSAIWPFEARHEDELSFQASDLFTITRRTGEWWSARRIDKNGRVLDSGIVPRNYLTRAEDMTTQPWYFGKMNRFEAQNNLLAPGNQSNAFLVRHSEKDDVGFVLSVRASSRVKHFKILTADERNFFVEGSHHFSSVMDLVEHYSEHSLNATGPLGQACRRKKPQTMDLNHLCVDEWELPKEEFTLEEELGSGYFADVYRGRWKNYIRVAVKILKSDSELNRREFRREVQILKSLRHPHLISLFAVCSASSPYYIITELMENGSLLTFLRSSEGQGLDVSCLVVMATQVCDGMCYLEQQKHIHRDLAARNVLVGEDYVCKVADFGLARVIKEPFYISDEKKIPYKWSAPEAISHGKFSNKSDVWSFGILLYEIITHGSIPYPAFSNQEVYQQVAEGYRMPRPPGCPLYWYDGLMMKCWMLEADDRPDFKTIQTQLEAQHYELDGSDRYDEN